MKRVKVHYKQVNEDCEAFLIKDEKDLEEFTIFLKFCTENIVQTMLKTTLPDEHFDHIVLNFVALERNLAKMGVMMAKTTGRNPIYMVEESAQQYFRGVKKALENGEQVVLNDSGGWSTLGEEVSLVKIIREEPLRLNVKYQINHDTRYLVVENDAELEQEAKRYLEKVDPKYSYITRLRSWTEKGLRSLFKEFIDKGGKVFYVYTTGLDYEQARGFYNLAYEAGIREFEVHMSAALSYEYTKVLKNLMDREGASLVLHNANINKETKRTRQCMA